MLILSLQVRAKSVSTWVTAIRAGFIITVFLRPVTAVLKNGSIYMDPYAGS